MRWWLLSCLVLAFSCTPTDPIEVGRLLVGDARTSSFSGNALSCTHCHAVAKDDTRQLPGAPLMGVLARDSFWGGSVLSPLEAVNVCLSVFMRGELLSKNEDKSRAIYAYLVSLNGAASAAERVSQPLTVVENVASLPRGNSDDGAAVWSKACAGCHGAPHTGIGRINDTMSLVPEASEEYARGTDFSADLVIIEKVRHGAFFGVGGIMPPFSQQSLSDADLSDLLSYLDAER